MSCKVISPEKAVVGAWDIRRCAEPWSPHAESKTREDAHDAARQRADTEAQIRQAFERGVRDGERQGRERQVAESRPMLERLLRTIEEIAGLKDQLRREAERDVLELSVAIARRILNRQLAVDPDAIHGLLQAALGRLRAQELVRVRVHPLQDAALRKFAQASPVLSAAEIFSDPQLPPGGLVFETRRGNLEASIDAQLGEIERGLADRMQRSWR